MTKPLRIVFLGTPEFAVASLDALCNSAHRVVAVVTAPDKPASRGLKLRTTAVKDYALKHNLALMQPVKLKDPVFLEQLRKIAADLHVVVAFRMLPEEVWGMPPLGTINLHASLLPQYRGAAPVNWAIINGEKKTGVTTFRINRDIDTGDIFMQQSVDIAESDDAGTLHDKLMAVGAELLVKTTDALSDGKIKPVKQELNPIADLKPAPKIFRETCRIDWTRPAPDINNFIRGLSPYPGAWTEMQSGSEQAPVKTVLKIFKCEVALQTGIAPGELMIRGDELFIGCRNAALKITELQQEGRKRMTAAEFLRGFQGVSTDRFMLP
ncbi:MAG: methionyl-tRNA formyltransferase [Bacteroidia bacterium]|nr:methionyl-tRNA formyltransferase [Bacteroidia bacterium]